MSKSIVTALVFLALSVGVSAQEESVSGVSIPGYQAKLIALALSESERFNIEVERYEVTVYKRDKGYVVDFLDSEFVDTAENALGSPPGALPTFEVFLDSNFRLVRSNFVR